MLAFLNKYKLLFSIGFLSSAIIAFQLALMQILSIVQWYHFAYMIISVALLGFGAAGSVLAIFRKKLINRAEILLPVLMISTGISMALVTEISQKPSVRFDSYFLFADYSQIKGLLFTYLLFFIPFFLGALAIGLVFVKYVEEIGKIYFANLLGSGVGGLLALVLILLYLPKQLPACISILPVLSGFMITPKKKKFLLAGFAVFALIITSWKMLNPPQLVLSQYKDLSKALLLPNAEIKMERPGAYGLIQTVTSPVLRYAPGLSLTAQKAAKVKMATFVNGDWFGAITNLNKTDTSLILDYTTFALPYIMSKRNRVLVLRSGTGIDVAHALSRKAEAVVAVEPNSEIVSMFRNELAGISDSLFYKPEVSVRNIEPRTFLLMDTSQYDLIVLPMAGTFGGSSGLYALQEQFILTKEAFHKMWNKLNAGAAICITSWMDYPVRNPLKILATMVETVEDMGKNPKDHIAAIRSWGTITFVMTKTALQEQEIQRIRSFCEEMMFDPAVLPGLSVEERVRYNQFENNAFFTYVDKIISKERKELYSDYDFNIQPATDDKPYFSQFIKWKSLHRLAGFFGNRSIPFFEIGYLLVLVTFIQISIASFVLILLPLFKIGWRERNKFWIILYFGGIGLGYMFVEMVLIQRFILYFGNPVYSASAVITCMLIFSGIGSYISNYFFLKTKRLLLIFGAIVLILFTYSFILTPVLQQTVHVRLIYKLLIVCLLIAPLAFFMGIPFPAGITSISRMNSKEIPWAWGLNGCVSVVSTAIATIVAVEMGFTWVMLFAALAYSLPFIVQVKWNLKSN